MSKLIRLHILFGIVLFLSTTVFRYSEYQSARADENAENKDRISTKAIAFLTLTPLEKSWLSAHQTMPYRYTIYSGFVIEPKWLRSDYTCFLALFLLKPKPKSANLKVMHVDNGR